MQASRHLLLAALIVLACTVAVDGRSAGHLPSFDKSPTTESLGEGLRQPDEKGLPSFVTRIEDAQKEGDDTTTYLFTMTGCEYKKLEAEKSMEDHVKAAIQKTIVNETHLTDDHVNVVIEGGDAYQILNVKKEEEKEEEKDNNYKDAKEGDQEESESQDHASDEEAESDSDNSLLETSTASMYAVVTVDTAVDGTLQTDGLGNRVAAAIMNVKNIMKVTEGATIVVSDPQVVTKGPEGKLGQPGPPGPPGPEGPEGEAGDHAEIKDFEEHPKGFAHPWMLGWAIIIHILSLILAYVKVKKELKKGRAEIQKLVQEKGAAPA